MANKDYYDRIADALELLAGDDSHINDDFPTIDYYKRIADALETLAQKGGGGSGSALPAVTADDNGDVLTVVEGAWAKAAPSGGGVLIVNATTEDDTTTLDKTWQEIHDHGFCVVCIEDEDGVNFEIVLSVYTDDGSYIVYTFTGIENKTYTADSANGYPAYSGGK